MPEPSSIQEGARLMTANPSPGQLSAAAALHPSAAGGSTVTDTGISGETYVTLGSLFTPCPCKAFPCIRVLVLAGLSRWPVSSLCKPALAG